MQVLGQTRRTSPVPDRSLVSCALPGGQAARPGVIPTTPVVQPCPGRAGAHPFERTMSIIQAGAEAPNFELDSHQDSKVSLASFKGEKNVLLVFYPLDFTPT